MPGWGNYSFLPSKTEAVPIYRCLKKPSWKLCAYLLSRMHDWHLSILPIHSFRYGTEKNWFFILVREIKSQLSQTDHKKKKNQFCKQNGNWWLQWGRGHIFQLNKMFGFTRQKLLFHFWNLKKMFKILSFQRSYLKIKKWWNQVTLKILNEAFKHF